LPQYNKEKKPNTVVDKIDSACNLEAGFEALPKIIIGISKFEQMGMREKIRLTSH